MPKRPNSVAGYGMALNDGMFIVQSAIIKSLVKDRPCVIVGRCADYVLRGHPACLNIFICASMEDRVKRIMERYELGERSAKEAIREMDKSRRQYYEKYTDRKWGDRSAHQVIFNVSLLGMENTVDVYKRQGQRYLRSCKIVHWTSCICFYSTKNRHENKSQYSKVRYHANGFSSQRGYVTNATTALRICRDKIYRINIRNQWSKGRLLKSGESQRSDGRYAYNI